MFNYSCFYQKKKKKLSNIFINNTVGSETKNRICDPKHTKFFGLKFKEGPHE